MRGHCPRQRADVEARDEPLCDSNTRQNQQQVFADEGRISFRVVDDRPLPIDYFEHPQ